MTAKKNTPAHYRVFTGPQAKGNTATVTLVNQLPASNSKSANSTCVFIQPLNQQQFRIRWFSNNHAIQRCGHGTLAAAAFLREHFGYDKVTFQSDIETLVTHDCGNHQFSLQLPIESLIDSDKIALPLQHLRLRQTIECNGYLIVELTDNASVKDFSLTDEIKQIIEQRALIITARTGTSSCCFRYFAPAYGVLEDMATGSAASVLWPFWGGNVDERLTCEQLSVDGGLMELRGVDGGVLVIGEVKGC